VVGDGRKIHGRNLITGNFQVAQQISFIFKILFAVRCDKLYAKVTKNMMKKPSRRDFLKLTTNSLLGLSGLLGLGGLARFLSYDMDPPLPSEYDLGPAGDYPPGSQTLLMHIPAVLIHNNSGYLAISLVCTHLGCTVEQKDGGYECPCHGSRYDSQGDVMRGPSNIPLKRLRAEINEAGNIILHTN
jgi:nitrite reductase/ring-hydroxylating ferredoxin subunit